jgi:hypothetical protein
MAWKLTNMYNRGDGAPAPMNAVISNDTKKIRTDLIHLILLEMNQEEQAQQ